MAEKVSNEKAPKKDFIKGLKSEFRKIIWPNKEDLTIAVVSVTVALGVLIAVLDLIIKFGLNLLIG